MVPVYRIIILILTSVVFMIADVRIIYGQSVAIGGRVTAGLIPALKVVNPSPSNIYSPGDLNINIGIYALKYFKTGRIGLKTGLEAGGVPFRIGVDAARKAFGTGTGGNNQIGSLYTLNALTYKAFTISAAYKLPVKNRFIEFTAGASIRHYLYGNGGWDEMALTYNRSIPYNPDDPSAGPPDVRARVNTLDQFHLSFPVSVDYAVRVNKRSQVKFGILYNIAKPLPGELEVMMYGQMYNGSFRPRTGYWGFNVQYERLSKNSAESYRKRVIRADYISKFRKSIFVETYIRPGLLSANYDMRIKKGTNSGLGFSAGAGLGSQYYTKVSNNNKSAARRMLALPLGINYIIGENKHGIELGMGITPQLTLNKVRDRSTETNGTFFPFRIGYRFQPIKEGLVARAAWAPIVEKSRSPYPDPYDRSNFGVSFGYSFK